MRLPRRRGLGLLLSALLLTAAAPPAAAALAPAVLDRVDRLVRDRLADGRVPGLALALLDGSSVPVVRGYGTADLEQGTPVGGGSVFPLASITKTYTALAILVLAQEGKLSTGDPLARYLPDFPGADGTTLRDLLVHTSGVAEITVLPDFANDEARDWTPQELLSLIAEASPLEPPGVSCAYSDSGYVLLGLVIEEVSGQPFTDFVRERVARPLGMTSVAAGSHRALIPGRVAGYVKEAHGWVNAPYASLEAGWAAGGLVARAGDVARLALALRPDGPLLRPDSYEEMLAPVRLADGRPCRAAFPGAEVTYGYGLDILSFADLPGHRAIGKGGVFAGFSSYFAAFEGTDLTLAAFANADGSLPFTVATVHDVAKLLLEAVPGQP